MFRTHGNEQLDNRFWKIALVVLVAASVSAAVYWSRLYDSAPLLLLHAVSSLAPCTAGSRQCGHPAVSDDDCAARLGHPPSSQQSASCGKRPHPDANVQVKPGNSEALKRAVVMPTDNGTAMFVPEADLVARKPALLATNRCARMDRPFSQMGACSLPDHNATCCRHGPCSSFLGCSGCRGMHVYAAMLLHQVQMRV